MSNTALSLAYQPRFPRDYRPGIGIIGCGGIVQNAHLPAYTKNNLHVVGAHDINMDNVRAAQQKFGFQHAFESLDDLLTHPDIQIVDIATHPDQRVPLMRRAMEAGKHILAQKPLALTVAEAKDVVGEAERRGLTIAVNQNGRWSPPWRIATLLIQQGVIGEVLAVTHLYDMQFGWIPGTVFDELKHFAIYDYSVHWLDISRCWLDGKTFEAVRARDYRTPHQPERGKTPWGMWVEVACGDGTSAMIRGVGCANTKLSGHPFWVHGTQGTIRGSVLGRDYVELEQDGTTIHYRLDGAWFPDGFAGTMGELQCAIAEKREPYNSARHNLRSLQLTLAACDSADEGGAAISLGEL
jgi:predicted dehydrogenase